MEEVSGIDAAESVMWTREDWPEGLIISYGTDAIYSTTVDGDGSRGLMVMPQRIAQEASDCRAVLLSHDMEAIWPDSDSVAGFLQNPKLD
ncbi:unnamed protein product, partial [Durusdinium trenchii]